MNLKEVISSSMLVLHFASNAGKGLCLQTKELVFARLVRLENFLRWMGVLPAFLAEKVPTIHFTGHPAVCHALCIIFVRCRLLMQNPVPPVRKQLRLGLLGATCVRLAPTVLVTALVV